MILRSYQNEAISAIRKFWADGGENPLVEMATGTGKSLTIAGLTKELLHEYPSLRVICLVHVRELVAQNVKAMLQCWPGAPIGINSAGLNRRDRQSQILFASIQSVFREDGYSLGARDLVLIDEAHLVPPSGEGMYKTFLAKLRESVSDLRVVGFTATPYRTGSGRLDDGKNRLFSEIVYSYGIKRGIEDEYLSNLLSKATETEIDLSGVHVVAGEFSGKELEIAVDKDFITEAAVKEIITFGKARKAWVCFCTGVEHATHVRDELRRHEIAAEMVSGKTSKPERDRILRDFQAGKIQALTNCNVLTTGFDAPGIDLIALLRPTLSTGLYVQMVGRGTRRAPDKENCLILDFAGNVKRHGPVDKIEVRKKKEKTKASITLSEKKCPQCDALVHVTTVECPECGHDFREEFLPKHDFTADGEHSILSNGNPIWIEVSDYHLYEHQKVGSPPSVRVEYQCGMFTYHREWLLFEHSNSFRRAKAQSWWRRAGGGDPPPIKVREALTRARVELGKIRAIQIRPNGKYFEVVGWKTERIMA